MGAARRAAADADAAPPPYPEGTPDYTRYTINEYHTVGNGIKPPFTTIVKFDLNEPAIKWRIPFGDDPALAARGITGTGAPATNNGIIVTASGLVFGAGLDNHIRAWDSETGRATVVVAIRRQLHRLAGDVRDGRQAVSARRRGEHRGRTRLSASARRRGAGRPDGLGRLRAARTPRLIGSGVYLPTSVLTR